MRTTRKLKSYKPSGFKAKTSHYDKDAADYAVTFVENLCHTKGTRAGKPFELIDWQEQIIRDVFGILKPNGYRQFNTAYIEIPKKMGKSELAAAVALLLTCGDGEYNCGGLNVTMKDNVARLSDGTLADSSACLFDCVKKAVSFGIPFYDAVKCASQTPAELIGVKKGRVEVGYDADLLVLDNEMNIKAVIIGGSFFENNL